MIYILSGSVAEKKKDELIVMTPGGVGYEIKVQSSKFKVQKGDEIQLYTYLKVAENSMEIYGFETPEERTFFLLLLSVSGVGPKSAMNILSLGSIEHIQDAILRGDVSYLTAVQGMGKKTAERLVMELKSKIGKETSGADSPNIGGILSDIIDGLSGMGYSREEAKQVALSLDIEGKKVEDLLREALKQLSRQ
jgi:Holliday junction DNA helicase RuvA